MPHSKNYSYYNLPLILLFLLAVSILTMLAISSIERETKEQVKASLNTVLQITLNTYQTSIERRKRDVAEIAMSDSVVHISQSLLQNNLSERPILLRRVQQIMRPKLGRENDLSFAIISPQRINIGVSDAASLGRKSLIHLQRPDYLTRAFAGETMFIPTLISHPLNTAGESQSRLGVFVAAPIKTAGKVIAVLAVQLNLSDFVTRITALARLGKSGETYAFDSNGMLITESRFDHQLRKIGLIGRDEKSIFRIRIADPGGNMLEGYRPELTASERPLTLMAGDAVRRKAGFNLNGYRDYRGVNVFGAWLWDESLGFGITTEIDVDEALRPFFQTRLIIIGVLSITIMMALGLMVHVNRIQGARKRELQEAHGMLEQRVADRTWELNEVRRSLEFANRELEIQAKTDGLTGLANRRSFDQHLQSEWLRCRRDQSSLGIILLDIDYFKNYNDRYGHPSGDSCLKTIAGVLRKQQSNRRPGDLIARYGGEEFVIILPAASDSHVGRVCEQLRSDIERLQIQHEASKLAEKVVTVSIGYAIEHQFHDSHAHTLLSLADQALYQAKDAGRNCVIGATACIDSEEEV